MAETAAATSETAKAKRRKVEPLNKPVMFSHGTLECKSLAESRPFYEEFLGLDVVRHGKISMLLRCGGYWGLVCLEAGEKRAKVGVRNHWGIDLESRDAVDRAQELAWQHKDRYGIQKIMKPTEMHGTYGFYLQDRDGNWWEFQYAGEGQREGRGRFDKHFEHGDIIEM
jgi:catechol 2,3-dioxygenase-like lactoylglutathione lyase family enzyme